MNNLLRFSDYDVFGYLATGMAAFVLWDLLAGTHLAVNAEWSVSGGVLIVVSAYIVGQIVAAPASWLLERELVFKALGRPSKILTHDRPGTGFRGFLAHSVLGDYFTPLHPSVRERLRDVAGGVRDPEKLFQLAYPATMGVPLVRDKLETFLRLYGFCRNLSFVALLGAPLLAGKAMWLLYVGAAGPSEVFAQSGLALLAGTGLFHRYLKFLRLFGLTTLANYAGGTPLSRAMENVSNDAG